MSIAGTRLISHTSENPFLSVGQSISNVSMYHGNFTMDERLVEKVPLTEWFLLEATPDHCVVRFGQSHEHHVTIEFSDVKGRLVIRFIRPSATLNRLWLRMNATREETVYGCGEQFSHFNLRGRKYPLWVSEQGVGRNKKTLETFLADTHGGAGGDYYTTYFPQPTFVSSRKYYVHVDGSSYMVFDFRAPDCHELYFWGFPDQVMVSKQDSFPALLTDLTEILGRQPKLPDWLYEGVWLGLQGGTQTVIEKLNHAMSKGLKVSAVWAQDWEGKRITEFGKQLMWNWKWDSSLYPGLDRELPRLRERGVRFLGYINCFLALEGDLYREARQRGYLVRNPDGRGDFQIVITTFPAAMVDLTHPDAVRWLKQVIRENMIEFGLSGWMADFGEYLPTDAVLHNGESAELLHNLWPVLWAKLNREAVEEAGRLGDVVFFTRAGHSGTGRYTTMMWAGDQNVDWSLDDGLPSVVTAALSLGMSGVGLHHSDIGGYTTLFHMRRTKELFMRWAEQAAFTVLMRTHEGNRPDENWQFDSDDETLHHYARMSQIHVALAPYLKTLVRENAEFGIPVIRPLFFHYDEDERSYLVQDEYLLGRDLLVSPVLKEGETVHSAYLPPDQWRHLWTGQLVHEGMANVSAPFGYPPVFYREGTSFQALFARIQQQFSTFPDPNPI